METARANAAVIVRAVNSYDELLDALRRTADAIPGIASHGKYYADAIVADLRAAIANAEKRV